ncbi:MAG: hypothetical protein RAO92_05765 [Candidatus Euphemobacter frigidus]|nr:hypothetical protein [Candidatus Euphemobacter frigidus]MDP8275891.1 hypothetical protein [Candidatus Euphemobacter frigidus]
MQKDLDFQIKFFEDLIRDDSDFVDALLPLAEAYTKKGWVEKGLRLDERLVRLKPGDSSVFYNLGCSCALLNREENALAALKKALDLGYDDLEWMEKDPDLAALRKSDEYQKLIREYFPFARGNSESGK